VYPVCELVLAPPLWTAGALWLVVGRCSFFFGKKINCVFRTVSPKMSLRRETWEIVWHEPCETRKHMLAFLTNCYKLQYECVCVMLTCCDFTTLLKRRKRKEEQNNYIEKKLRAHAEKSQCFSHTHTFIPYQMYANELLLLLEFHVDEFEKRRSWTKIQFIMANKTCTESDDIAISSCKLHKPRSRSG